jgi:hypothetical protein
MGVREFVEQQDGQGGCLSGHQEGVLRGSEVEYCTAESTRRRDLGVVAREHLDQVTAGVARTHALLGSGHQGRSEILRFRGTLRARRTDSRVEMETTAPGSEGAVMPTLPLTFRTAVRRRWLAAAVILALVTPFSAAHVAAAPLGPAPSVKAVFDPLCKHFEEQNWVEKRADKAGLKKALKTLVVWISKRPWGQARGLGRVPDFAYGVGSTVILEFTKASCPPRTLELAAQSLPYLAPDVQQQPTYPSQQDYATVYQLPHIAEALVASEAARDFNNSGATGDRAARLGTV